MLDAAFGNHRSDLIEPFVDIFVGIKDKLSPEKLDVIRKTAVVIYR